MFPHLLIDISWTWYIHMYTHKEFPEVSRGRSWTLVHCSFFPPSSSSLNPHILTCVSRDSSEPKSLFPNCSTDLDQFPGALKCVQELLFFCLCWSSIKWGVSVPLSWWFFWPKEQEFDLISHAGVNLFTGEDTGLSLKTNLLISNASTQERNTQGFVSGAM